MPVNTEELQLEWRKMYETLVAELYGETAQEIATVLHGFGAKSGRHEYLSRGFPRLEVQQDHKQPITQHAQKSFDPRSAKSYDTHEVWTTFGLGRQILFGRCSTG
jgi:hypothetical protein